MSSILTHPIFRPLGILIVLQAVLLHYSWAVLLMMDAWASWATPVAAIWHLFGQWTSLALFIAATMSLAGLFCLSRMMKIFLLMPQQFLTLLSAGGCFVAIMSGQYADGVIHPKIFIAADQIWAIIFAALYAVAILQILVRIR